MHRKHLLLQLPFVASCERQMFLRGTWDTSFLPRAVRSSHFVTAAAAAAAVLQQQQPACNRRAAAASAAATAWCCGRRCCRPHLHHRGGHHHRGGGGGGSAAASYSQTWHATATCGRSNRSNQSLGNQHRCNARTPWSAPFTYSKIGQRVYYRTAYCSLKLRSLWYSSLEHFMLFILYHGNMICCWVNSSNAAPTTYLLFPGYVGRS